MSFDDEYADAQALAERGQWEDALIHYDQALKIDSGHKEAHCQMGSVLLRLGRHDDALDCYGRALGIDPGHKEAHLGKGAVLEAAGRQREALSCYDRALEIDPRYKEALDRRDGIQGKESGEAGHDPKPPAEQPARTATEAEPASGRDRPGADPAPGFCRECGNGLGGRILFCAACHKPTKPRVGMEGGGPYSPALYEATAPLRRAQKAEVERMRELQVHDATWRLRDTLKAVKADLDADGRSRQSAVDGWNVRESRTAEEADAARKALRAAEKRLPAAESTLRASKKTLIQSEDNLAAAIRNLDAAKNRVSSAQSGLYEAERAVEAAQRRVDSAESELRSANEAVPPAQREVDSAESQAYSAESTLNSARAELSSAQSKLSAVEGRLRSAESRRDSAMSALSSAESDLYSAQNRSDGEGERYARSRVDAAQSELNYAESEVSSAQSDMYYPQSEVNSAQMSVDSAQGDADLARRELSEARDILREAQQRVSAAHNELSAAQNNLSAAHNRVAAAQAELADARNRERAALDKKKEAERDLATAQKELAAAQRAMPSAEVLLSAKRDWEGAETESQAASKRAEMARNRLAAARRKEKAAQMLRDAEGSHQDAEKARQTAGQDNILSLEQAVKDGGQWAAKPLRAAKDLMAAEEGLRAARVRRADGVLEEAKDAVRLAQRWLTEDQDALKAAERRQKVAQRWLHDAREEQWTEQGERWARAQQKAFADEQRAAGALRDLADGWAEDRVRWASDAERDAERWAAFAEARAAEEDRDADRRRREEDNLRYADTRFGAILESLERIPEPGRTKDNIGLYRRGVEAAKSYRLASGAGIRWPASLDHLRSMTPDRHRSLAAMAAGGDGDAAYVRIRDRLGGEGIPNAVFRELFEDPHGGGYAVRPWDGEGGIEDILKGLGGVHYDHDRDIEFAREHPEAAQVISTGQMSDEALDALDKALERICGSLDEISRDGEVGVTPTMDRRMLFEEGMLVLTDSHLMLYDERGLEERESIPLDAVRKCDTGLLGWLKRSSSLNIQYGDDQKRSFRLPKGFSAAHSASEEYSIWNYMVNRRLKTSKREGAALHIHTEPPGAVVLVDGTPYGTTPTTLVKPLRAESILSKKYKVQVHLEGYEPRTESASTKVKDKLDKLDIRLKPRKMADPVADKGLEAYRRQMPGLPEHEQFVREHALDGEHGTLVLSRDSVIILSANKRTLLRIPYGALGKVEKKTKIVGGVQGLAISYRQEGGLEDDAHFAMDRSKKGDRDAAYREVERRLNAKKQEWSDRGPGFASGLTRLPRSGYTTVRLADAVLPPGDGGGPAAGGSAAPAKGARLDTPAGPQGVPVPTASRSGDEGWSRTMPTRTIGRGSRLSILAATRRRSTALTGP